MVEGEELDLSSQGLTDMDIEGVCVFLKDNPKIKVLQIGINDIGPKGAKALALNNTLTTLNLNSNIIIDKGAKALIQNDTLTTLDVDDNDIDPELKRLLLLKITRNAEAAEAIKTMKTMPFGFFQGVNIENSNTFNMCFGFK